MLILPAIDVLDGQAVRLKQGVEHTKKIYSDNPPDIGLKWQSFGAEIIHVVNLDGAFGRAKNVETIQNIVKAVDIPIELGGGIRSIEDVRQWLDIGVSRVIIGTLALSNPEIVEDSITEFGAEKIIIGIDGRDNKVAIHGWEEQTETGVLALALNMKALGATRIIYTDVHRDGELVGPNIESTDALARESAMHVIASGGFSSMEHFEKLAALKNPLIDGAIVGTAIYEGAIELTDLTSRFRSR